MKIKFAIYFCFLMCSLQGQDIYHTNLQSFLQNTHDLPVGNWVFNNSETANLNSDFWYGDVTGTNQPATFQEFSQKANVVVNGPGLNPWDAGYGIQNIQTINSGDKCLLVIWLQSTDGEGKVNLFVENSTTFSKEAIFTLDVSNQWARYIVPFEADQTYTAGQLTLGLHLAWQAQTIGVGGMAILNYANTVALEDLPSQTNSEQYGGFEPDAPWRAPAADRIEELRKSDLTILVEDMDGNPVPDATVEVEMIRHDFAFGTAAVTRLFAGNNGQNNTYESKLLDLDGAGHGFNWVVFENALKWPGWENNWITTPPETAGAVQWLNNNEIKLRGHTLLWPGFQNMPNDIQNNQSDLPYLRNRIFEHIEEITTYPGIAGNVAEWDVLNEITTNRSLENVFQGSPGYPTGRELYPEIFQKLEEFDAETKTYINDYVTISQANSGGGLHDLKLDFIQEVIDAGVELDGVGFQAHIGASPTSIYAVKDILDTFYNRFGTTAKITEYDTHEVMDDDLAAVYLRDFLTMVFSHESTDGFLMWGFWDGAHWNNNAMMFNEDWSLKPAGQTFIDMVFDEWWTEENGQTDATGAYRTRGYKGWYKVTIDCGSTTVTDTIELLEDVILVKSDGQLVTGLTQNLANWDVKIFPNPASDRLYLRQSGNDLIQIEIYDETGRMVLKEKTSATDLTLPLDFGNGVYEIRLHSDEKTKSEIIIIQK